MASAAWLGAPNPGIDNDRDRRLLDDDANLVAGLETAVGADGRSQGHDRGGSGFLKSFGQNGIGIDIGEHHETFLHQLLGGLEGFDGIGKEVARIGMDLEFDPLGKAG